MPEVLLVIKLFIEGNGILFLPEFLQWETYLLLRVCWNVSL